MPKADAKARPAGDHLSAFYASTITASPMQNDGKGILKPIQESAFYD
jgi:hypothetical protein